MNIIFKGGDNMNKMLLYISEEVSDRLSEMAKKLRFTYQAQE